MADEKNDNKDAKAEAAEKPAKDAAAKAESTESKKAAAKKDAPKAEAKKETAAKAEAKKDEAKAESKKADAKKADAKGEKKAKKKPKAKKEAKGKGESKADKKDAKKAPAKRAKETPSAPPVVRAKARYVRVAPRKARLVADQVRGLHIEQALALLQFSPRGASRDIQKLIESAAANAENNHDLVGDEMRIASITVDEGPTLRRFRPRALGRATPINKRTSHIAVALTPAEDD
jgi:ribosomal protein L22